MILPTKHDNLNKNILVLGSDIIKAIKNDKNKIEDLYQYLRDLKDVNVERFYDTVLFLWLMDFVEFEESSHTLKIKM